MLRVNHFKQFQTISNHFKPFFQNPRQSYNFFLTFHSQIVQFYSQIVQIFLFSSQLVPISPNWSQLVKKSQKETKNGRHKRDDRNRLLPGNKQVQLFYDICKCFAQIVFTNTNFYQILVFGDTNISIKIIFGLFLGIFWTN